MFPTLQFAPIPARKQGEAIRTTDMHTRPAPPRTAETARAADLKARLRRAAKKAFWMMGED